MSQDCFPQAPGASVTATCAVCPVPVLEKGKLIHHSDVCVFAGSSYRKLMDHEIIQGMKKEKKRDC